MKKFIAIILFFFAIGAGIFLAYIVFEKDPKKDGLIPTKVEDVSEDEYLQANTMEISEITNHNTADNCWITYEDKVYEVTELLGNLEGVTEDDCGSELLVELSEQSKALIAPYIISSVSK